MAIPTVIISTIFQIAGGNPKMFNIKRIFPPPHFSNQFIAYKNNSYLEKSGKRLL